MPTGSIMVALALVALSLTACAAEPDANRQAADGGRRASRTDGAQSADSSPGAPAQASATPVPAEVAEASAKDPGVRDDGYIVRPDPGTVLNRDTNVDNPGTLPEGSGDQPGESGTNSGTGSGPTPQSSPGGFSKRALGGHCGRADLKPCFAIDWETGAVFPDFHDWLTAYLKGDPAAVRLAPYVLEARPDIVLAAPQETRDDLEVVFDGMESIPEDRVMEPEAVPRTAAFDQSVKNLDNFTLEREFGGY